MTVSPLDWLRRLQSAFAAGAQLLAPTSAACLLCGKPQYAARGAGSIDQAKLTPQLRQSLCGACLSAIPWLTRIACTRCGRGVPCEDCIRSPHGAFQFNRSAVHYSPAMREMLALYKYRGNERLAPLLADMLLPAFEAMTVEIMQRTSIARSPNMKFNSSFSDCWHAVSYVPVSSEREIERGFNQAEQLAGGIARRFNLPLLRLLSRSRHTEKQSFKSRAERQRDTRSLFNAQAAEMATLQKPKDYSHLQAIHSSCIIRILLIDDIYTTGSTAEACSQALLKAAVLPIEIYVLTWARS
ncbi:putative amidophosphoribosyltransferase [Paenibacillus endophyticus]|uniref:Putative amidophosphoribosyltransferase n=1 Tax=Paenibacillus endophyticus TaxID=1294268 RepID=A0A7W5CD32_9BACL|nr:ComF family protein [Paenibacillus endophyticus]MBB3154624.1 putative amidophosphoribosyltransferase [Paenibacillus endophyticus]